MYFNVIEKGKVRSYICLKVCSDGTCLIAEVKRGFVNDDLFYPMWENRLQSIENLEEAFDFVKIFRNLEIKIYEGERGIPFIIEWKGETWRQGNRKFYQGESICRWWPFEMKKEFYRKYKKAFGSFFQKEK